MSGRAHQPRRKDRDDERKSTISADRQATDRMMPYCSASASARTRASAQGTAVRMRGSSRLYDKPVSRLEHDHQRCQQEERRLRHRVVKTQRGLDHRLAHARPREHGLDDDLAADRIADDQLNTVTTASNALRAACDHDDARPRPWRANSCSRCPALRASSAHHGGHRDSAVMVIVGSTR
jgi:hypothetical protein